MGDTQEISGAEDRQLRLRDGRILGYAQYGDPAGIPLLAVHGTPGARIMMRPAQQYAHKKGIRLIAPDRPGYGLSSACSNYSFEQWAADIKELVSFLDIDRFWLFGVSGGGSFATALAALMPRQVKGVALVSPVGVFDEQVRKSWSFRHYMLFSLLPRFPFMIKLLVTIARLLLFFGTPVFLKIFIIGLSRPDRAILKNSLFRRSLLEAFFEGLHHGGEGVFEDLRLFAALQALPLEKITMPVLVWQGSNDKMVPAQAAFRLAQSLSDVEVVELPGQGHFWIYDHFEDVLSRLLDGPRI